MSEKKQISGVAASATLQKIPVRGAWWQPVFVTVFAVGVAAAVVKVVKQRVRQTA
jgi:hypothetical protein